MTKHENMTL